MPRTIRPAATAATPFAVWPFFARLFVAGLFVAGLFVASPVLAASKTTAAKTTKPTSTTKATGAQTSAPVSAANAATDPADAKLDVKTDVERKIVQAQQQAAPDLPVGKATCPKELAVSKAKLPVGKYKCTVVIDGVVAPYDVLIATGGFQKGGTYSVVASKAIIDTRKLIAIARGQLDAADRETATIECGQRRVVVADPGKAIACSITTAAGVQKIAFVVKDKVGTVSLKV